MSIWVRSQNSCVLCKALDIWVEGEEVHANSSEIYIGKYKTEAEALAVLDMIQKAIQKIAKHPDHAPVFQMPEAGFLREG